MGDEGFLRSAERIKDEVEAHPRGALIEALAEAMHSIEDDGGEGRHIAYYRSLAYATVEVMPALFMDEDALCDEPGCGAHPGAAEPVQVPADGSVVPGVPPEPREAPGGDAGLVCCCPLIDVSTDPTKPEFVLGHPAGCPVHGVEHDAKAAAAEARARRAEPSPSAVGGAEGPSEKGVNRAGGVSPVPDTTPEIPDEAVQAFCTAVYRHTRADCDQPYNHPIECGGVPAGLRAARPYLVAAALREAAGALDETGEKLHTYAAMDWAAAWLRERAAGLFPGTGTPPRHHRAPVGETDTTPPDRDPYDSAKGGVSDADEWAAGAARETTPGGEGRVPPPRCCSWLPTTSGCGPLPGWP